MTEKGTSADQQILAQQQALQAKVKKSVWLGAAVVALFLVLYIANQIIQNRGDADSKAGESSSESSYETTQQETSPDQVTLTNAELEQYRDTFREDLADFEVSTQPILDNQDIANWKPKRVASLIAKKDKALNEFARSSFQTAANTLSSLVPEVEQLEQDWKTAYLSKLEESAAFLADEKINQARFAFSQAIEIMPANPQGRELKIKLDGYEEIINVRRALRVAQVENNVAKQIELLDTLVNLDPTLTDERNRLNELKRERTSSSHANIILQANKALDNGNTANARELLAQAKTLKPNDAATKSLSQRINNQSQQSVLQRRLIEVEGLARQQRWQQVLQKSTSYSAMHPGQERFVTLQTQADGIVKAQRRVLQFLARPERVSDQGIRDAAVDTLQQALPLAADSNELSSQLRQLAAIIDEYSTALTVTINSDEKSYILVLGVGHVGEIKQKQIELKPGQYTLEARRDGYKTTRLQINVSATSENTFYLANNEKI